MDEARFMAEKMVHRCGELAPFIVASICNSRRAVANGELHSLLRRSWIAILASKFSRFVPLITHSAYTLSISPILEGSATGFAC